WFCPALPSEKARSFKQDQLFPCQSLLSLSRGAILLNVLKVVIKITIKCWCKMKLFIKGFSSVASFAVVQLVGKSVLLLAMYILSFALSSVEFGYISLAQSTFMLFLVVLGANLQSAVVRYYPEFGFQGIIKSLRPFFVLQSLLAVLVSICALVVGLFSGVSELRYFAILPFAGLLASYVLALSVVARYKNDIFGYGLTALPKPVLVLLVSLL